MLSKDRLRARVDKSYKGPAVIQRVLTERGGSRGRHQFSVKIEGICPGDHSFLFLELVIVHVSLMEIGRRFLWCMPRTAPSAAWVPHQFHRYGGWRRYT